MHVPEQPAPTRSPKPPRRPRGALLRAIAMRFAVGLLCYNTAIAGYLWFLALKQDRDVVALYRSSGVAQGAPDSAATDLRRYQLIRRPIIDRLLPDGHRGTLVMHELGGPAGVAWTQSSAIGLLAGSLTRELSRGGALAGETVEIHERAHLLRTYHSEVVAALMRQIPPPAPGEYAATNPGEHFAEMAAQAYQILVVPENRRRRFDAALHLRVVEERVPGTSGFMLWYLRTMDTSAPQFAVLQQTARELVAERLPLWEPIYAALETQQRANGTMAPWPAVTPRHRLAQAIASLEEEGTRSTRVMAWALTPGERLLGWVGL